MSFNHCNNQACLCFASCVFSNVRLDIPQLFLRGASVGVGAIDRRRQNFYCAIHLNQILSSKPTSSFETRQRRSPKPAFCSILPFFWVAVCKGLRKSKLAELAPGFGSGLVDLIERNRRNSGLF
jgi:hypothetical protein